MPMCKMAFIICNFALTARRSLAIYSVDSGKNAVNIGRNEFPRRSAHARTALVQTGQSFEWIMPRFP